MKRRLRAPTKQELAWELAGQIIDKAQFTAVAFADHPILVVRDEDGLPLACYIVPKKPA